MKLIRWNLDKAKKLKDLRNIELEYIATLIAENKYFGVADVKNRPGQKMFILDYDNYVICVPFVETANEIFIKTAFRNRKLNKQIKGDPHE